MNQSQRNFLVEKIEESVNARVRVLRDSVPEYPNLINYLHHKIMSNDFDIKDKEELKQQIIDRCINTKDGKNWNEVSRSSWDKNNTIKFGLTDFFIIPPEFQEKLDEYESENKKIRQEINLIESQSDTLIVRIKLASNSTLESMIKEVDDMGDLKLMDTKLKALGGG
jgi:hypothetical protein